MARNKTLGYAETFSAPTGENGGVCFQNCIELQEPRIDSYVFHRAGSFQGMLFTDWLLRSHHRKRICVTQEQAKCALLADMRESLLPIKQQKGHRDTVRFLQRTKNDRIKPVPSTEWQSIYFSASSLSIGSNSTLLKMVAKGGELINPAMVYCLNKSFYAEDEWNLSRYHVTDFTDSPRVDCFQLSKWIFNAPVISEVIPAGRQTGRALSLDRSFVRTELILGIK